MNRFLYVLALLALPTVGYADELDKGDTAWMLTSSALVLFMLLPGLSLFYAGLVRSKNVLSVLMQCFSITCLVSILWLVFGYSLAFSDGGTINNWVGGFSNTFLSNVTRNSMSGTIPESVFVMFQLTFAIITPALVVGGFAERMKFSSMLWFSALWFAIVYLPVCHWVWGGATGFFALGEDGALDFAGGTVVHINAGIAALVLALMLGKRQGYPDRISPPHNLPFAVLGTGLLWFGWFGFNAGSAGAAQRGRIGRRATRRCR